MCKSEIDAEVLAEIRRTVNHITTSQCEQRAEAAIVVPSVWGEGGGGASNNKCLTSDIITNGAHPEAPCWQMDFLLKYSYYMIRPKDQPSHSDDHYNRQFLYIYQFSPLPSLQFN